MKNKTVFWSGILGAAIFIAASVVGGLQLEGYSPISQFISESYATGTAFGPYLQYTFVISGLLLALFAFMAPSALPKSKSVRIFFFLIAIFYGLGTVVTGIFPCDAGCRPDPVHPTISQFIHNISGSLTYMVVPFCLIAIGLSLRKWVGARRLSNYSLVLGSLSLAFVILLFADAEGPFKGLYQRIVESSILLWVMYCAFYILKQPKTLKA